NSGDPRGRFALRRRKPARRADAAHGREEHCALRRARFRHAGRREVRLRPRDAAPRRPQPLGRARRRDARRRPVPAVGTRGGSALRLRPGRNLLLLGMALLAVGLLGSLWSTAFMLMPLLLAAGIVFIVLDALDLRKLIDAVSIARPAGAQIGRAH